MTKSALTKACYDHKLERVTALIEAGADVDGNDNELWHGDASGCLSGAPYYTPLGEACRSRNGTTDVQTQIVQALLDAGAEVDKRNYRNETAFHFACQCGRKETIRLIANAGADLTAIGCLGNGINALVNSYAPDKPGGEKLAGLKLLLELGVDPRLAGDNERDLVEDTADYTGNLTSRSRSDKQRGLAMLELMELVGERYPEWDALEAWLKRHRAAQLKGDAKARKAQEKITKLVSQVGESGFEKAAIRALGKKAAGRFDDLRRMTRGLLMTPEVVAHESWGTLVRHMLGLMASYGDVTEATYGERLDVEQIADDEGGAMDHYADEHLSTIEHCLTACRAEGASEREDFTALVRDLCEGKFERIGYMSFGDDEAVQLIRHLEGIKYADTDELRGVAKRCFPFAAW